MAALYLLLQKCSRPRSEGLGTPQDARDLSLVFCELTVCDIVSVDQCVWRRQFGIKDVLYAYVAILLKILITHQLLKSNGSPLTIFKFRSAPVCSCPSLLFQRRRVRTQNVGAFWVVCTTVKNTLRTSHCI